MVAYEELFRSRVQHPPEVVPHRRWTRVRYPLPDRTIDVALWREPVETIIAAPARALDGFVLHMRHGRGGLDLGDPDFRRVYSIQTSDPGLARELLDTRTRALIAFTGRVAMPTRARDRCYSYTIAGGFVSARAATFDDHGDALEDTILAVDALAHRSDALADAWLRAADALGAQVRGQVWTVAGDLVLWIPRPSGAYTASVARRPPGNGAGPRRAELATRVVDDRQRVAWIETLTPSAAELRAAITELEGRRGGPPYR